jgi:hypothetical protein
VSGTILPKYKLLLISINQPCMYQGENMLEGLGSSGLRHAEAKEEEDWGPPAFLGGVNDFKPVKNA